MKKIVGITLGIMTALGGFVDIGQIVFTMQAGALFGYRLMWTIALGTAGIIVYMEMCGRIAVVAKEPVFAVVRTGLGYRMGLATLIASNLLNLITCAAELGGIAMVLHLLTGLPEKLLLIGAAGLLLAAVSVLRFQWIERIFGLSGLLMIVFAVSAAALHPQWSELARGFAPTFPPHADHRTFWLYAYFAVGIFSALLMAYEVHFYSSGAIEEDWTPEDLGENFFVAALGSVLGAVLTAALLVLGVLVLMPRGIFPQMLSTTVLTAAFPYGRTALVIGLFATLACLAGAAIETALSGGYNLCQFLNLPWGKSRPAKTAGVFTAIWRGMFVLAMIVATGAQPLQLVNVSIVFGMAVMPFTYYPILRVAADRNIMGEHVNRRIDTVVGVVFLILITVAAAAAIPLLIVTHAGQP